MLLQQKEAERQARLRDEQRRPQLAEENGRRASDNAAAARKAEEERTTQRRIDAVTEQLRRGVTDPLGVESLPVGVYKQIQQQVADEKTYADKQREIDAERKRQERAIATQEDDVSSMRRHAANRKFDIANPYPDKPTDTAEKVDPFLAKALSTVKPDIFLDIDPKTNKPVLDRGAWMAEVTKTADELRMASKAGKTSPSVVTPQPGADSSVLTPSEQSKLSRMSVAAQSSFRKVMASGNADAIAQARAKLAQVP